MGELLLLALLASGARAAGPMQPLSSFGLTPRSLLSLGFTDSEQGLFELSAARWYMGAERERKLRELAVHAGSAHAQHPPAKREAIELPRMDLQLPERDSAGTLDHWYDGGGDRASASDVVPAGPIAAQASTPLHAPAERHAENAAIVPTPIAVGGLQSRGGAPELARLVAGRFPGAGACELAASGTQAAWRGVAGLLERYAQGARLPRPGWEQEVADAYREGFAARWEGGGRIGVTVTEDKRLFAHRGLWVGNPVLLKPDGSVELVLNLPWMESIAQDGAFADARLVKVRNALSALDGAQRSRLVEQALGGRDPQSMSYGLLYRLAGWMQAELIGSAAGEAEQLRGAAAARIEGHPVWRAIYEGALNAAVSLTRGVGAGTSHPELWKPASDAELWRLVREANAGSGSAAQALGARLEAAPALVGYAEYLDLAMEPNRAAVRRAVAAAPRACRVSGRLAQAQDAAGIDAFARSCLGDGAPPFLAELSAMSAADATRSGYRAYLEDLIAGRGGRGFDEMAGRRRTWLASLVVAQPARAASLWDASPETVRRALIAALAASPSAASALSTLESERPEAAAARAALPAGSRHVEDILRRAVEMPAAKLEAAGEAAALRLKAQPQSFVRLLREPAVVEPLVEASRTGGVDVDFLTAVAFQEGYYLHAERLSQGAMAPSFEGGSPMGLDSFGDLVETMKKRGFLRKDFDAFESAGTKLNEADHRFRNVRFRDAEAALEAMAGLVRYKRAQFLSDATALGLKTDTLSREDLEMWTYVYYNYRDPRSVLKRGLGEVHRAVGPAHPLYNAQRVGATAAYLRDLGLFREE